MKKPVIGITCISDEMEPHSCVDTLYTLLDVRTLFIFDSSILVHVLRMHILLQTCA